MAVAGETTLEYTPTWVVAAVCTVIVAISFAVERILHYTGKVYIYIYIYIYIYMEYAVLSLFLFQHLCDFFLSVFEEKGPEATIRSLTENQGRSDTLFLYFSLSLYSSLQMPLICFLFPGSSGFLNHAFNGG